MRPNATAVMTATAKTIGSVEATTEVEIMSTACKFVRQECDLDSELGTNRCQLLAAMSVVVLPEADLDGSHGDPT